MPNIKLPHTKPGHVKATPVKNNVELGYVELPAPLQVSAVGVIPLEATSEKWCWKLETTIYGESTNTEYVTVAKTDTEYRDLIRVDPGSFNPSPYQPETAWWAALRAGLKGATPGERGLPGTNGRNGIDGRNGTNGVDGQRGTQGPQGKPGANVLPTQEAILQEVGDSSSPVAQIIENKIRIFGNAEIPKLVTPVANKAVAEAIGKDSTIVAAAASAVDANPKIAELIASTWKRGALPDNDLDSTTILSGQYHSSNAYHPSNPFPGKFFTVNIRDFKGVGLFRSETVVTVEDRPRSATRSYTTKWGAWEYGVTKTDVDKAILDAQKPDVKKELFKVVPLAFTASQGPFSDLYTDHTERIIRKYAVMPKRFKIHLSNRNPTQNSNGGPVTITNISVSPSTADGTVTKTIAVQGIRELTDGAELVTEWITNPATEGENLALTISWTAPADAKIMQLQGGSWLTTPRVAGHTANTVGWEKKKTSSFHIWIEAEVPANIPVVCGHGDSITIGTASTDPVTDSYLARYAYKQGAIPVILAEHGSSLSGWITSNHRWNQYPGIDLSKIVDVTITFLGQNDLAVAGLTLAELKERYGKIHELIKTNIGGPIYVGAVTPSSKAAEIEAVRKSYNAWLKTLPHNERGYIDFAKAVGTTDDENLNPEYSADGLHPNTAGHHEMSNEVLKTPVTPFTLTPGELQKLSNR